LEESKTNGIESTGYAEFTTFVNKRFNQEEAVELFAELVNFHNKSSPYDNEIIWKSANILNSSLWWQSWATSKLQQLAIKILLIPTSSAAAERNFSTFGFIHNKIRNRLKNDRVKKLVYIYGNLRMYNGLVKIQKKKRLVILMMIMKMMIKMMMMKVMKMMIVLIMIVYLGLKQML